MWDVEEIENESFDDPYPHSLFLDLLSAYPDGFRVATNKEDRIVGYCVLSKSAARPFETLVASIAVHPDYRRLGIASLLLSDAISRTRSLDPMTKRIVLQVRIDNQSAISLYLKMGFVKSSIIKDYYGRGKHAIEMVLFL